MWTFGCRMSGEEARPWLDSASCVLDEGEAGGFVACVCKWSVSAFLSGRKGGWTRPRGRMN